MVRHGNWWKHAGKRYVRKSGSICLKWVDGSVCHNIPVEIAKRNRATSFIGLLMWVLVAQKLRVFDAFGCKWFYLETVNWLSKMMVWISSKIIVHPITVSMSLRWASMERQRFQFDHFGNQRIAYSHRSTEELWAGFRCKMASDILVAPSSKWVSTEHHRLLVLHLGQSLGCATALSHNHSIGRLDGHNGQ